MWVYNDRVRKPLLYVLPWLGLIWIVILPTGYPSKTSLLVQLVFFAVGLVASFRLIFLERLRGRSAYYVPLLAYATYFISQVGLFVFTGEVMVE